MKFFLATKNLKKLNELSRILAPLNITVLCERDLDFQLDEVEENGATFEENAIIKAKYAMQMTGLPAIADDSGLCVDALNGAPGIFSARFAGEPCDNDKNNQKLLKLLKGLPVNERTARFVSVVACCFPDGRIITVEGSCEGYIAEDFHGNGGFGYDPLFISEKGSFGEISPEEKDSISHRGKALRKLYEKLSTILSEE